MRTTTGFRCALLGALLPTYLTTALPAQQKTAAKPTAKMIAPNPKLPPEKVVEIVMNALKTNDAQDHGIAQTFQFASPQNRMVTGPLPHFVQMVKTPSYLPMLNFKSMTRQPIKVLGDRAQQAVFITTKTGAKFGYLFGLSKQKTGVYKGCWMSDSVMRLPQRPSMISPSTT